MRVAVAFAIAVGLSLAAVHPSGEASPSSDPPRIEANDNRKPGGVLEDGVLRISLEAREGVWHVASDDGPGIPVQAFAEAGKEPSVPGPLIRVPLGTEIRATVRNALPGDETLLVYGLGARRSGEAANAIDVAPGQIKDVRFTADAEGTFYYWGTTSGKPLDAFRARDSTLGGALIVDPEGELNPLDDRVFVIQMHMDTLLTPEGDINFSREFLAINGKTWPHTERLMYDVGDSIRWRYINASWDIHPMHLHGFYFRVDSRGDMKRDTIYAPEKRRMVVTEPLAPGETATMVWSPDRPGGWIFHCHNTFHVVPAPIIAGEDRMPPEEAIHHDPDNHMEVGMGGLFISMFVRPPPGHEIDEPKRREITLHVLSDSVAGDATRRYAYVIQKGDKAPAKDSIAVPSHPIVMWKGEPTSIKVVNRMEEATAVHWHGLEIESYFDGVAGLGGYPEFPTPAVHPGDTFEVRYTPPRAGTFMYHTHMSDVVQQSRGLAGAIVILEEGEEWDPEHDRMILMTQKPRLFGLRVNGKDRPDGWEMRPRERYRVRLMNITLFNGGLRVRLTRDGETVAWRYLAKDGWAAEPRQRTVRAADQVVSVGETFDFEFVPERAGEHSLEVRSGNGRVLKRLPITVK